MTSVLPGDVLADRFVVEEQVGKGGIGRVFRGWDLVVERAVAIKVLHDLSPTDVKRFEREALMLAKTETPGLVRHVHHALTDAGVPYLVMEWLEGETLAKRMEHVGFDLAEAIELGVAMCRPLGELHARGLVHRDLKPENFVMVGPAAREVVLIDLGLARAADGGETRVTATGCVLGTPGYMAPEQVRGEPTDARTDVFALGCVIYECISGYAAFAGENFFAVRTKILLTTPPALTQLCPEVPGALQSLVVRMLAKAPEDRFASAIEVARALEALPAMPVGPRRTWSTSRPPTLAPGAVLRPLQLPPTISSWTGIVLVHAAESLAARGDEIRAAVPEGKVDFVDGGYVVVALPPAAEHAALARELAVAALRLRSVFPATFVITAGIDTLEELIDRSAGVLEVTTRSEVFDPTLRDAGAIHVDPLTAGQLAAAYEVDARMGHAGYRLLRSR